MKTPASNVVPAMVAHYLGAASGSIRRACEEICMPQSTEALLDIADRLAAAARYFARGDIAAGLSVPVVDPRIGASAMGKARTLKKLEALARARAALAEKRERAKAKKSRPPRSKERMVTPAGHAKPLADIAPKPPAGGDAGSANVTDS